MPTRWGAVLFGIKRALCQARRALRDLGAGPQFLAKSKDAGFLVTLGTSRTPLWSDDRQEERAYQLGKVQNLGRAAADLDGVLIPAGAVFSFWKQIGRASRRRGFVTGRMLQQGCLVPAAGGGLCQLSNALYDTALQAGCEIVERHAHSRIVAGSIAAAGRDATVAWNYVDLRFRAPAAMRIDARMTRDELVIRFRAPHDVTASTVIRPHIARTEQGHVGAVARTCATCGEKGCFRHEHRSEELQTVSATHLGVCAFLVDENWPEFEEYIERARRPGDVFGLPLDGATWGLARYRWENERFARVGSAPLQALRRAIAVRRAPAQGARRREAEQFGAQRIATRLSRLLTPDVTKIVVAQSLLPILWRQGHLGGREVEVLMTRLPMAKLHARLDRALDNHPERSTLGDFRAPRELVEDEDAALTYAARIVSPHAEITSLYAEKSIALPWRQPPVRPLNRGAPTPRRITFPGPTVARKGAYELREAARALDLEVVLLGSELEGPEFWNGIKTLKFDAGGRQWLEQVAAVVQPAIAEDRPRHLLTALAAGVPVIASPACGLAPRPGLSVVSADDPAALMAALRACLG
jgi:hypothetical protein